MRHNPTFKVIIELFSLENGFTSGSLSNNRSSSEHGLNTLSIAKTDPLLCF